MSDSTATLRCRRCNVEYMNLLDGNLCDYCIKTVRDAKRAEDNSEARIKAIKAVIDEHGIDEVARVLAEGAKQKETYEKKESCYA